MRPIRLGVFAASASLMVLPGCSRRMMRWAESLDKQGGKDSVVVNMLRQKARPCPNNRRPLLPAFAEG